MDAAAGSGDRGGTPAPPPASVLVVDDEAGIRSVLSSALRGAGWRVDAVESGEACLERVRPEQLRRDLAGRLAAGARRPGDPRSVA